jgi:hypothetical protein
VPQNGKGPLERAFLVMPSRPASETAEIDRDVAVRGRAVAQLPQVVQAPALRPAHSGHRAHVEVAGGDRSDALPSPLTSTGSLLFVFVPFPSCPWVFAPQHLTPPALVRPTSLLTPRARTALGATISAWTNQSVTPSR